MSSRSRESASFLLSAAVSGSSYDGEGEKEGEGEIEGRAEEREYMQQYNTFPVHKILVLKMHTTSSLSKSSFASVAI